MFTRTSYGIFCLVLWSLPANADDENLVRISADELVLDGEEVIGSGMVELSLGPHQLQADEVIWDASLQRLEMVNGRFVAAGFPAIDFSQGVWSEQEFQFFGATWRDKDRAFYGTAHSLALGSTGVLVGEEVELGCDCPGLSPWSLRSREVIWEPSERFFLKGARVGVFGVTFLPLPPIRLPLSRKSGFLMPELGYGVDGFRVKTPLYIVLNRSADVTLTPEIRSERSLRLMSETRVALTGGSGSVEAATGYDWERESVRGAGRWQFHWAEKRWNLATVGQIIGDDDYLKDYGDRFMERQTPWTEDRLLFSWRQVELWTDVFHSEQQTTQQLGVLSTYLPATEGPLGSLVGAEVLGMVSGQGTDPWSVGPQQMLGRARFYIERPAVLGPVMIRPSFEGRSQVVGDDLEVSGAGGFELRLLGFSMANSYFRVEPGLQLISEFGEAGSVGVIAPELLIRQVSRSGTLVDLILSGRLGEGSQELDGWFGVEQSRLRWWGHGRADFAGATEFGSVWQVPFEDLETNVVWIWGRNLDMSESFHQGSVEFDWRLPGPMSALSVGAGVGMDLHAVETLRHHAGLQYYHPKGCLGLGIDGWFDADRKWPDLALNLTIAPARSALATPQSRPPVLSQPPLR